SRSNVASPDALDDSSPPSSSSSHASDALTTTSVVHSRSPAGCAGACHSTTPGAVDASTCRGAGASSARPAHAISVHARRAVAGATNDRPMIVLNALLVTATG